MLTIWVPNDARNLGWPPSARLTNQTFHQVESASEEFPPPALITQTVLPEVFTGKWRARIGSVSDEASGRVSVEGKEEWDEEVVSIPECLEGLLSDAEMSSRVYQEHAEEHDMASDAARFGVMDLDGRDWSDLRFLNIKEAFLVSPQHHSSCREILT
jgi:hypothetical protein